MLSKTGQRAIAVVVATCFLFRQFSSSFVQPDHANFKEFDKARQVKDHTNDNELSEIIGSENTFRMLVNEGDFLPSRTVSYDPDLSPVCRPSWKRSSGPIRRIYFAHSRKAGGTTLFKFFKFVARLYGWKFSSIEGTPAEPPVRHDTFYVTHLREPVARAISMYKYDRRWSCRKLVFSGRFPDFTPTANNSQTLEHFIEHESGKPEQAQCLKMPRKKQKLWNCARNCYLRWYGQPFNCLANITRSFESARRMLWGYNLVVITERLSDPEYISGLLRMFGDLRTNMLNKTHKMYCFEQARYWNSKYPAVLNNATVANLTKLNALDIRLYNEINHCPDGVVFPQFDPGEETNVAGEI